MSYHVSYSGDIHFSLPLFVYYKKYSKTCIALTVDKNNAYSSKLKDHRFAAFYSIFRHPILFENSSHY